MSMLVKKSRTWDMTCSQGDLACDFPVQESAHCLLIQVDSSSHTNCIVRSFKLQCLLIQVGSPHYSRWNAPQTKLQSAFAYLLIRHLDGGLGALRPRTRVERDAWLRRFLNSLSWSIRIRHFCFLEIDLSNTTTFKCCGCHVNRTCKQARMSQEIPRPWPRDTSHSSSWSSAKPLLRPLHPPSLGKPARWCPFPRLVPL
jgi:hypothetical protein